MMEGNILPFPWMLGCALLLWLCWWHLLSLPGPAQSHGVCRSCLGIPKGLLCVPKLWGVGHAHHPFWSLGSWKVEAEVAAAVGHVRGEVRAGNCTLDLVPMPPSSFTLVGLSAFLDSGQHFPCRAPGDRCILSWPC